MSEGLNIGLSAAEENSVLCRMRREAGLAIFSSALRNSATSVKSAPIGVAALKDHARTTGTDSATIEKSALLNGARIQLTTADKDLSRDDAVRLVNAYKDQAAPRGQVVSDHYLADDASTY